MVCVLGKKTVSQFGETQTTPPLPLDKPVADDYTLHILQQPAFFLQYFSLHNDFDSVINSTQCRVVAKVEMMQK